MSYLFIYLYIYFGNWTQSKPTGMFGKTSAQEDRDRSKCKYHQIQDKFKTIEKKHFLSLDSSSLVLEDYSPTYTTLKSIYTLYILYARSMSIIIPQQIITLSNTEQKLSDNVKSKQLNVLLFPFLTSLSTFLLSTHHVPIVYTYYRYFQSSLLQ